MRPSRSAATIASERVDRMAAATASEMSTTAPADQIHHDCRAFNREDAKACDRRIREANEPQASKRLGFGPSLTSLRRFSRFCDAARGSVPLFRDFRIQSAFVGIVLAVRVDPLPQDFA